jgi:hypothetical protein
MRQLDQQLHLSKMEAVRTYSEPKYSAGSSGQLTPCYNGRYDCSLGTAHPGLYRLLAAGESQIVASWRLGKLRFH